MIERSKPVFFLACQHFSITIIKQYITCKTFVCVSQWVMDVMRAQDETAKGCEIYIICFFSHFSLEVYDINLTVSNLFKRIAFICRFNSHRQFLF